MFLKSMQIIIVFNLKHSPLVLLLCHSCLNCILYHTIYNFTVVTLSPGSTKQIAFLTLGDP